MKETEEKVYRKLKKPIQERQLVGLLYKGANTEEPEFKIVEPHQIGIHRTTGNAILSGWYLPNNENQSTAENSGWRIYLLEQIAEVVPLIETFDNNRPGYSPGCNKLMKEIIEEV